MADSEAKRKWDAENTVVIAVKLNRHTDADIIAAIGDPPSKAARMKELIRQAISQSK